MERWDLILLAFNQTRVIPLISLQWKRKGEIHESWEVIVSTQGLDIPSAHKQRNDGRKYGYTQVKIFTCSLMLRSSLSDKGMTSPKEHLVSSKVVRRPELNPRGGSFGCSVKGGNKGS